MKKVEIIIVILLTSALLIACVDTSQKSDGANKLESTNKTVVLEEEQTQVDYEMVGDVMTIEPGRVDLLTGDIVQTYQVDQASLDKVYLGERVGIVKTGADSLEVVAYPVEDFNIRYSNMGLAIESFRGRISTFEIKEEGKEVTMIVGQETKTLIYNGDMDLEGIEACQVDVIDQKWISAIYDEATSQEMTIESLKRTDQGAMVIGGLDSQGQSHELIPNHEVRNFNLSDLEVGHKLQVYGQETEGRDGTYFHVNKLRRIEGEQ